MRTWRHRLSVRTHPSQGWKRGSIPRGAAAVGQRAMAFLLGLCHTYRMDQEYTKLRQMVHEIGRKRLSIERRVQEVTDPKERRALENEHKLLGQEIVAFKESIAKIENA